MHLNKSVSPKIFVLGIFLNKSWSSNLIIMAKKYSGALINLIWKVFHNSNTPNENKLFLTTIWVPSNSHDPGSKVGVKVSASKVELWNSFDASRSGCRSQLGEIVFEVKKVSVKSLFSKISIYKRQLYHDGQYWLTSRAKWRRRPVLPLNSEEWWQYLPIHPTQN